MRELSPQEMEVVRQLAQGLTLEEIARATPYTYSQVKSIVRDLRRELSLSRTRDIVVILRELGVIDGGRA